MRFRGGSTEGSQRKYSEGRGIRLSLKRRYRTRKARICSVSRLTRRNLTETHTVSPDGDIFDTLRKAHIE
jgi:hypothetical protein